MHDIADIYHKKGIDMIKLGCTFTILAIICLHKSITPKFYHFKEIKKDILDKVRKNWLMDQQFCLPVKLFWTRFSIGI